MPRNRDFSPSALDDHSAPRLRVDWRPQSFFEKRVWQFLIFLPRWLRTESGREVIFSAHDVDLLQGLLERDFGGYTWGPPLRGVGKRGTQLETNIHRQVMVLASRWRGTMRYFRALRRELEGCTGEEQILILRQELVIV